MTTKRIMEIEDEGAGFPDFYHGGQGFCSRSTREARARRAKSLIKLIRNEVYADGRTFEDHENLAKLRGRVI
jgi:hypothetical protein